ncbi:NaeI family type II restriction endonuclease [Amycolatopsis minnesotensis]|uniref:Type II restriction enzyme NaeI domain-containing protein n=1 Tax=Amycolatopsis minnesotensis TaxID=337894 RepID=A0ABN2RPK5_9PSEU
MAAAPRRAGRPRRELKGVSAEANQLAELLLEQIDAAGLSVEAVHERMRSPAFSVATLYRRLRGELLHVDGQLYLDAVLEVCTPEEQREAVRERAEPLLGTFAGQRDTAAEENDEPSDSADGLASELAAARAEIKTLQQELLRVERERLRDERERLLASAADTEKTGQVVSAQAMRAIAQLGEEVRELRRALGSANTAPGTPAAARETAPPVLHQIPENPAETDTELETVHEAWRRMDPDGTRTASVLRRTLDTVLDGERTGRYQWSQLSKVEKTYFVSRVERELSHEFDQVGGQLMPFALDGVEVGIRYSSTGSWSIPREAVSKPCLLVRMDDSRAQCSAGLVRVRPEFLSESANRDGKRTLNRAGLAAVRHLFQQELPSNVLSGLSEEDRAAIFSRTSGQQRVEELLRRAQGVAIGRTAFVTVAKQAEGLKRARDARRSLAGQGIIVLGAVHDHAKALKGLGLPSLRKGELVSLRLVRGRPGRGGAPGIMLGADRWVPARPDDPVQELPYPYERLISPGATGQRR